MKKVTHSLAAFSIFVLMTTCGGGGASSPTAAITGNVNTSVAAKPSARSAAITGSSLAGVTVTVVDSNGNVVATGRTDGNGNYSITVPQNGVYVVQATSGGAVLKAVAAVGATGVTVNVNPASTAALLLLAQKLGAPNMGDKGTQFSSAISGMSRTDINTAVADISNIQYFGSVAQLVRDDLQNCINPSLDLGPGPTALLVGAVTIGRHGNGGSGTGSAAAAGAGSGSGSACLSPSGAPCSSGTGTNTSIVVLTGTGTSTGAGTTTTCFSCPPDAPCPALCWVDTGPATSTLTNTSTSTYSGSNTGTGTGTGVCIGFGSGTNTGTTTGTGTVCYPPPSCSVCMMIACPVGTGTEPAASTQCVGCNTGTACPDVCVGGTDTGITTGTGTVIGMLTIINASSGTSPSTSTLTGTATGPNTL